MPLNMAMHEVHPGIVRLEAQGYETTGIDHDCVTAEWVGMRRRQMSAIVVSLSHPVAGNHLKGSTV